MLKIGFQLKQVRERLAKVSDSICFFLFVAVFVRCLRCFVLFCFCLFVGASLGSLFKARRFFMRYLFLLCVPCFVAGSVELTDGLPFFMLLHLQL